MKNVQSPVVIVGAGPAGLAMAACLGKQGVPFTVLEQNDQVGSSWEGHYERLHLHTDKAHSALPYFDFPKDYPRYPSRQQVVDYLGAYARHHHIEPLFGQRIVGAGKEGRDWVLRSQDTVYRTSALVVAAGYNRDPRCPTWPGQDQYRGEILHSGRYTQGERFRGRQVLVVGLGNSGGEIAIDLWEHGAHATLAVRSPVNVIKREILGVPFLTLGILQSPLPSRLADALNAPVMRALVGDLRPYGLRRPADGPMTQIREQGRVPFIDVGTVKLIKEGHVQVRPGIARFTETGVVFTDGRTADVDAVVLATGYRPNVQDWLKVPEPALFKSGDGLYFCGYYVSPTGMLREIAREARQLAPRIAGRLRQTA